MEKNSEQQPSRRPMGGNALANAGRMIMEAKPNGGAQVEEEKHPPRKQWGVPRQQVPQQNKFKNQKDAIENVKLDNIKVREQDELDEDSEGSEIGGDRCVENEEEKVQAQQRFKTRQQQDWNYLKQTLGGSQQKGWKDQQMPQQQQQQNQDWIDNPNDDMLNFHEKVDTLLEKEEELIGQHMHLIKENAKLLTKEGELISYVQGKSNNTG